jgi:hypothetical protein
MTAFEIREEGGGGGLCAVANTIPGHARVICTHEDGSVSLLQVETCVLL